MLKKVQNKIVIKKTTLDYWKMLSSILEQRPKDLYLYYPGMLKENCIKGSGKLLKYKDMKFFDLLLCAKFTNIHLKGFPLCIFPKEQLTTFVNYMDPYPGIFIEKCNTCKEKRNCYGVPKNYLDKFGDGEIRSFTKGDYLELHRRGVKKNSLDINRKRQKKTWDCYFKNVKGKILDAGAGFGDFLSFDPKRIIGIEKEKEKVDNSTGRKEKIDLRQGDILNLDFPDAYFEGVYSRFVLEHLSLKEAKLALKEIRRVLKPGAKLFLMVAGKDDKDEWYTHHEICFTRKLLSRLSKEAGFRKYKVFNASLLEEYKGFNFDCHIQNKFNYLRETAVCLIAEK